MAVHQLDKPFIQIITCLSSRFPSKSYLAVVTPKNLMSQIEGDLDLIFPNSYRRAQRVGDVDSNRFRGGCSDFQFGVGLSPHIYYLPGVNFDTAALL